MGPLIGAPVILAPTLAGTISSIGAGIAASGLSAVALGSLISLGLAGASVGIALANQPGKPARVDRTVRENLPAEESYIIHAGGRVRIGGIRAFGQTPDGYNRFRLLACHDGPYDGIESWWLGGREVTVEPDGRVSSPPWVRSQTGTFCWLMAKGGDGNETAWPQLLAQFPDQWSADHRLRGTAQVLAQFSSEGVASEKHLRLYQNGVPTVETLRRVGSIYDPRTNATAYSDNGVLWVVELMKRLLNLSNVDFDMSDVAIEADKADALVPTATGTEKRSRFAGYWSEQEGAETVLLDALRSTGTEIRLTDLNTFQVRLIDDQPPSEFTIPSRHMVAPFAFESGPEQPDIPNIALISYLSPERNYGIAEIPLHAIDSGFTTVGPAWARVEDEIARYGEQPLEIELRFCPSHAQAQRIGRRLFAEARAASGVFTMNMTGVAIKHAGVRYVTVPVPDTGDTFLARIPEPSEDPRAGTTSFPYVRVPTLSVWEPAVDEAPPPEILPEFNVFSNLVPIPDAFTEAASVAVPASANSAGSEVTNGTTFVRVSPLAVFSNVEAVYRVTPVGDAGGPYFGMAEQAGFASIVGNFVGQSLDFRARRFDSNEDVTDWSPVFTTVVANPDGVSDPTLQLQTLPGDELTIQVTAPSDIRVSDITLESGGTTLAHWAVHPGNTYSLTVSLPAPTSNTQQFTYIATAHASGLFSSNAIEQTHIIPPNPGGA